MLINTPLCKVIKGTTKLDIILTYVTYMVEKQKTICAELHKSKLP